MFTRSVKEVLRPPRCSWRLLAGQHLQLQRGRGFRKHFLVLPDHNQLSLMHPDRQPHVQAPAQR